MKRFRPAIFALLLLPLFWWLSTLCVFHTDLEIVNSGKNVRYTLNGRTSLVELLAIKNVRRIEIKTIGSPFPVGGKELTIEQAGQVVWRETLPMQFKTEPNKAAPLGDWWVDEKITARPHVVFERPLTLDGTFRLTARITGRNLQNTTLRLVGESGAEFGFRRGLLNNDCWIKDQNGKIIVSKVLDSTPTQHGAEIAEPVLWGLMAACGLIIGFTVLGWVFSLFAASRRDALPPLSKERLTTRHSTNGGKDALGFASRLTEAEQVKPVSIFPLKSWAVWLFVSCLTLLGLFLYLWVANRVLERLPHFQDDLCYLLRAKWLTAGILSPPMPGYWQHLDVPHTWFSTQTGQWLTIYPIGWPLMLAVGEWFHAAWVVPPVCGAIGLVLIYLIGKELYGNWTGWAAMVLAFLSPMAILMSASLLSHAATAMLLSLFMYWLITGWKKWSYWRMAGAGLALGYTFGIRPLTAVAVAVPAGVFLLVELIRLRFRRGAILALALLIFGGLVGTVPVLLDNYHSTGDPFLFTYTAGPKHHRWTLDNLSHSLKVTDATLSTVLPMAFGWGYGLVTGWPVFSLIYAFPLVAFLTGRASRYDWLLLATFVCVPVAYLGHEANGAHGYGPRFYYDVFFCLFLLTARGFAVLGELFSAPMHSLLSLNSMGQAPALNKGQAPALNQMNTRKWPLVVTGFFLALCASTLIMLPQRLRLYSGYNEITGELERAVAEMGMEQGIILLDYPDHCDWIMSANLFPADPFHPKLLVAKKLDDNTMLREVGSGLPMYLWTGSGLLTYEGP